MITYYIDSQNGNDKNDGLSPATPKMNHSLIKAGYGVNILFKCGNIYREKLTVTEGTSYGSYGEGNKPIFILSTDVSSPHDWVKTNKKNIWQCIKPVDGSVGNFIFNDNECTSTLRWTPNELAAEGDFWDSRYNDMFIIEHEKGKPSPQVLLMYSVGNPAEVYEHIEAASYAERHCGDIKPNTSFDGLVFMNSGVHGLAGYGDNVTIHNCEFCNIGGCCWSEKLKIRFGNAIEFWEYGNNILVENCVFKNLYDSCVTHQGPAEKTVPTRNFICRNNVFDTYGMAAFEYRDKMPIESEFTNNICKNAGCGFAMNGEALPRKSEIWPQPMGHHIFMWRIDHKTDGGSLLVADNDFGAAPVGAAIYSIISPDAEKQVTLQNNTYTPNDALVIRWGGKNYNNIEEFEKSY